MKTQPTATWKMSGDSKDAWQSRLAGRKPGVGRSVIKDLSTYPCRPWLMRLTPHRLRQWLFYRLYFNRLDIPDTLFEAATLAFAPSVRMRLHSTDVAHQAIALTGVYELETTRILCRVARTGGLLVDVGANYGYFSLLWAATQPENRAVAFECSPRNFPSLVANCEANGLNCRIDCRQFAVGRETGTMAFGLGPPEQTGWGGLLRRPEADSISVPVLPLDELFWDELDQIALLKIDTEGADTWVLQGAEACLRAGKIRHILYEQYPERMKELAVAPETAIELLRRYGYRVKALRGGEWYARL